MKSVLLIFGHLGVLAAALFVLLIILIATSGPSTRSGERAVVAFLVVAPLLWITACASLHRRLPAEMAWAAKLGLDGAFLLGGGVVMAMFGLTTLVVFNR